MQKRRNRSKKKIDFVLDDRTSTYPDELKSWKSKNKANNQN